MSLHIGDPAPDFELPSQSGQAVSLSSFRGKKSVVLYFYPKDDTSGCTAESCAFRDQYDVFQEAGAEIIGVSADSLESHRKFAGKYQLPFHLLSDGDGKLRRLYGVKATLGILPGRVTFVIDKVGVVRHMFSSQLQPKKHIEEALKLLKREVSS